MFFFRSQERPYLCEETILFVAYYYAILLCAYVFVFQVSTGVLMLYSLAYHLLIFLLFMLVHMSVFLMQCSCQPKFHVRDNKVLTYLLTYLLKSNSREILW